MGEFVEALRIFGCGDEDDIVKRGINFLLKEQSKSDGSWDRIEGNDAYTIYHATMVGVQGLLPSSCQGFGPCDRSVVEVLESWQELEDRKAIDLAMNGEIEDRLWVIRRTMKRASKTLRSIFASSNENKSHTLQDGDQVDPTTKRNVITSAKRLKLFAAMDSTKPIQNQKAITELKHLQNLEIGVHITLEFLAEVKLMKTVNKLRKHKDKSVASLSKSIRNAWKDQYRRQQQN